MFRYKNREYDDVVFFLFIIILFKCFCAVIIDFHFEMFFPPIHATAYSSLLFTRETLSYNLAIVHFSYMIDNSYTHFNVKIGNGRRYIIHTFEIERWPGEYLNCVEP